MSKQTLRKKKMNEICIMHAFDTEAADEPGAMHRVVATYEYLDPTAACFVEAAEKINSFKRMMKEDQQEFMRMLQIDGTVRENPYFWVEYCGVKIPADAINAISETAFTSRKIDIAHKAMRAAR